jgi:hypothetical protein
MPRRHSEYWGNNRNDIKILIKTNNVDCRTQLPANMKYIIFALLVLGFIYTLLESAFLWVYIINNLF